MMAFWSLSRHTDGDRLLKRWSSVLMVLLGLLEGVGSQRGGRALVLDYGVGGGRGRRAGGHRYGDDGAEGVVDAEVADGAVDQPAETLVLPRADHEHRRVPGLVDHDLAC